LTQKTCYNYTKQFGVFTTHIIVCGNYQTMLHQYIVETAVQWHCSILWVSWFILCF